MEEKKPLTSDEITKKHPMANLMNVIIAETLLRHNKLEEKDYLKEIGFEGTNLTEEKAVAVAIYNACHELSKVMLEFNEQIKAMLSTLKTVATAPQMQEFMEQTLKVMNKVKGDDENGRKE